MSLGNALRIATNGMQTSQLGLSTVSHNVVNSNNTNFSRQVVSTSAVSYNGLGAGVKLDNLQRITDKFLEIRSLVAQADIGYTTARSTYLSSIDGAFTNASAGGGLDSLIGNFYESFNQLATSPGDNALKRNVVQQAVLLSDSLRSVNASLDDIQTRIDNEITADIANLNVTLRQIYQLNSEITLQARGVGGANANDLLDRRQVEIEALAKQFKLSIATINDQGGFRISTENGRRLVDESGYVQLLRTPGIPFTGIGYQSVLVDGTLAPTVYDILPASLTQGKMKGLIDLRDTTVPNLLAELDTFTSALKTDVNAIHSRGSAFPPVNTLTTANTTGLAGVGADLYTSLSAGLAGSTFHLSVTDSTGNPISTTAGNSTVAVPIPPTPITLPGVGPFSLTNLAALINANTLVGAPAGGSGVTATAGTNASGQPVLTISANNSSYRVVLKNHTGDVLGTLGTNTFFSGTTSDDITVKDSIIANPGLISTGRMRSTDGGLSSLDNTTAVELAKAADTRLNFVAAGGLGPQHTTLAGYMNQMTSNVAVILADADSRTAFADTLANQLRELKTSVSGVNLNEELSLMLIYQNSFQASARIINVVNDLFDTLINTVR